MIPSSPPTLAYPGVELEIAQSLEFLLGRWSIHRVIDDHRDGGQVTFAGTADVQPTPTGASYQEAGQIRRSGHCGPARRALAMAALADGGVRLDFVDGRPFIAINLRTGQARAVHPCRADTYEVSFEVRSAQELVERWRVTGPEKDYSAETVWRRG